MITYLKFLFFILFKVVLFTVYNVLVFVLFLIAIPISLVEPLIFKNTSYKELKQNYKELYSAYITTGKSIITLEFKQKP